MHSQRQGQMRVQERTPAIHQSENRREMGKNNDRMS